MGNFRWRHLGHRAVITAALQMGAATAAGAGGDVRPHPRSFFSPNSPQFRFTDEAGKLRLLAWTGARGRRRYDLDKARAGTSAQDFITMT